MQQRVVGQLPQISQLDGVDDDGDGNGTFPRYCGKSAGACNNTKAKKRWMVERENRQALSERVAKAKQAANDRLYEKEAVIYVS